MTQTAEIQSFNPENGFGFLLLGDGRLMLFDVTACLAGPWQGQQVRVELAGDGHRVVRVEPTSLPDSSHPVTTLTEAAHRLRAEGLLQELTRGELEAIAGRLGLEGRPEEVPRVLAAYYAHPVLGEQRALDDRFARPGDGDLGARLTELLDEPADGDLALDSAPPSLRGGELPLHDPAFVEAVQRRRVASPADLALIDGANAMLAERADPRRVLCLADGSGAFCMALSRGRRLAEAGALPVSLSRPHLSRVVTA